MPRKSPSYLFLLAGALGFLLTAAGCAQSAAQHVVATSAPGVTVSMPASATPASSPTSLATAKPQSPSGTPMSAEVGNTHRPTAQPTAGLTEAPPTATPTSAQTPVPTPTETPVPTQTPTPSPTSTPALRQLTEGGCCTQPFWSPDSRQVLFIDQPAADQPLGIWGVTIDPAGAPTALYTSRIASYTADMAFVIERDDVDPDVTVIERVADGERWDAPTGGRSVSLSPSRTRIAWQVSNDDLNVERRTTELWVANLDGSEARAVATLPRGGLSGWIDEDTLLISSRESLEAREQIISALRLADGSRAELARGERLRGGSVSPDGAWYLYMLTFDADAEVNGLWIVRTDGTERRQIPRELFGSYRWRDAARLLLVPLQPDAESHELWELDMDTNQVRQLTNAGSLPFKIANNDWSVSPDGRHVVFVASHDRNLWLLTLAD